MTHVELLYLDGCPNHEPLHDRVRALINAHHLGATIETMPVASEDEARARRFLGSPTLRIDGVDVEPGAEDRTDFGIKCRLFLTPDGPRRMPAEAWLRAALKLCV